LPWVAKPFDAAIVWLHRPQKCSGEVVVFIASPAARHLTRETAEVNGGMWLG